jgi:site-specific DNA recombinase
MGAARRKGKYLGGRPLLGYDIDRETKRLVIDESEAVRVRQIFDLYLEHEGLIPTIQAINARGWRTKQWTTKAGKTVGGVPFTKNALHTLLTNAMYLGKVVYRDEIYEGEHDAIVDQATFDLTKKTLRGNRINAGDRVHGRSPGVLAGLIHCTACGGMMTHSTSGGRKKGKRYRYYVCGKAQKRGRKTCPRASLPAEEVERFVIGQLQSLTIDDDLLRETCRRVQSTLTTQRQKLEQEYAGLVTNIRRNEKAIEALSAPVTDVARDASRIESLASLNDQLLRDQQRRGELDAQIEVVMNAPDRHSILRAITDLETLWDHLTLSERGRLINLVIQRIDHDPADSTLSITLSASGLQSFGTRSASSEPHA